MSIVATDRTSTVTRSLTKVSIGKKYLMAISGLFAVLFVIGHMLGNLQIFLGQDQINTYAEKLRDLGPLLWIIRAFLFAVIVVHIYKGIQLKLQNWEARPARYIKEDTVQASLSSRTMIWTGLVVLAFIAYHLAHFTLHWTNPSYDSLVQVMSDGTSRPDVYSMMVLGFQNIWISLTYIVAVGLLCYHLTHAIGSMFQSMGVQNELARARIGKTSITISWLLFLGYISIPIGVLLGWASLPGGGY
jgi:succinate dehydrogenase / fumarate reductase cytochrome b subunit